jgi:hypothetical protein
MLVTLDGREVFQAVAMSSVVAMLLALFTLPALMAVLPVQVPKAHDAEKNAFMNRFGIFVVHLELEFVEPDGVWQSCSQYDCHWIKHRSVHRK